MKGNVEVVGAAAYIFMKKKSAVPVAPLTLLQSDWPKVHGVLPVLGAIWLN